MTARIGANTAASSDEPTGVSSAHKADDAPSGPISGTLTLGVICACERGAHGHGFIPAWYSARGSLQ